MYNKMEIQKAREVLGVAESSSMRDIKEAYRSLALKTHPDHNKADDATEKMKAINSAYEVLNKTENGEKTEIPINDTDIDAKLKQFFAFYAFFFKKKQPGVHDVISEETFQTILEDIETKIMDYAGKVFPRYQALFGISAPQIQRLLESCAEYDGHTFHFSGHSLRPEVLVCLLRYLADYKPKTRERCTLDLSENLLQHTEVIDALGYFIEHAQSPWALILDKCDLDLTQALSEQFMVNNKMYSLSIKGNQLSGDNVSRRLAAIIEKNKVLEAIDFSDNGFDTQELLSLAEAISKSQSLQKVSLEVVDRMDFEDFGASQVINWLLKNSHALQEISLQQRSLMKYQLALQVTEVNPRIKSLSLEQLSLHPEAMHSLLINNCPNLKKLSLYKCDLTNELLQTIAGAIPQALALEDLVIHEPGGLHLGQSAIFEAVSSNNTIKKLSFSHFNFSGTEDIQTKFPQKMVVQALKKLFRDNKTLTELNIEACNLISDTSAKQLAQIFKENNRTLTKIAMRGVVSGEGASIIDMQVHVNEIMQRPKTPTLFFSIKEQSTATKQAKAFSNEAINTLLAEIKQLITNRADTLKFEKNNNKESFHPSGRLAKYTDHYINQKQLEQLMDVALTGNFTRFDFSDENHLPSTLNGIILKKINNYHLDNNPNLVALNLSGNNLSGQIDELIKLLDYSQSLKTLHLANATMLPNELILLINAIANHPTLQTLSLPTCGYESHGTLYRNYPKEGSKSSAAIANLLKNNNTLRSINLSCEEATEEEFVTLLTALESSKTIESLALSIGCEFADEALAQVLRTNSVIKTLSIRGGGYYSSTATMAAVLNSPTLTELSLEGFSSNAKTPIPIDFEINRQLSIVSMLRCNLTYPVLGLLNALPLKKLDLSHNRLFADEHGTQLLELIRSKSDLLEELKLSDNLLDCNQDRALGDDSHFLVDLSAALKNCPRLKVVYLDDAGRFIAHDAIKCIRQLKAHNTFLQEIKYTIPEMLGGERYMLKDVWSYVAFLLEAIQLKNQGEWSNLEKFYQGHIEKMLKSIIGNIDLKLNGTSWDRLLGKRPDTSALQWTNTHLEILMYAAKGDYAVFHTRWENWKSEVGDCEETIDVSLSIMLDWLDEILLFYANSIKSFNLLNYPWVDVYPNQNILCPGYESKLDILENYQQQEQKAFEEKWAAERAERHAKEKADNELLAHALDEKDSSHEENRISLTF